MDDKNFAACVSHSINESDQVIKVVHFIHPKPTFHRNGYRYCGLHCRKAACHEIRFEHQAGTELARLHPVRWAPHVNIDFIESGEFAAMGATRHILRVAAAQLQAQWMFSICVSQKTFRVSMYQCAGRDHFGIKTRPTGNEP